MWGRTSESTRPRGETTGPDALYELRTHTHIVPQRRPKRFRLYTQKGEVSVIHQKTADIPFPPNHAKGKFIRTFYYLPPKAGFNWRGPARR